MPSVTKTPLCTVRWCAHPSDPDWHICIVCGALATEHAHVQSRAQVPARKKDKSNQVMLCNQHHREVDERQNGTHSHHIREIPGKGRTYFRMDLHGKTLFEKVLEPDSAAAETVEPHGFSRVKALPVEEVSAAAPSGSSPAVEQQTNSAGTVSTDGSSTAELPVGAGEKDAPLPPAASVPAGYDSWAKDIKAIAMVGRLWQFDLGDRALQGEKEFGEEAWQILDGGLGLARATIWNIMRVCESIPSSLRRGDLRWSHHQVIYKQDKETIDSWLDRCVEERWTIKQFKSALRKEGLLPPKKTVKRWTREELRAASADWADDWWDKYLKPFLDFLEKQDG